MNPYYDSLVWFVFILEIIPRTISWLENTSLKLINLLHSLTYLSLLNSFLLLVLITIFSDTWLTSLFSRTFSVIMNYTMWSSNLVFCIQLFATFFISHIFQDPRFSGPDFRVQVQGLDPGSVYDCSVCLFSCKCATYFQDCFS